MNNLKKILQQVLDYYNEVGCSRLLKILFIFCITSPVEWLKLKITNSSYIMVHDSSHDETLISYLSPSVIIVKHVSQVLIKK